jgi:hypothetical protein
MQQKAKGWLWVAVAPMFAVFGIFANRSRKLLVALIEDYSKTGNDTNAQRSIGKYSGDWRAPFVTGSTVFCSGAVTAVMQS